MVFAEGSSSGLGAQDHAQPCSRHGLRAPALGALLSANRPLLHPPLPGHGSDPNQGQPLHDQAEPTRVSLSRIPKPTQGPRQPLRATQLRSGEFPSWLSGNDPN